MHLHSLKPSIIHGDLKGVSLHVKADDCESHLHFFKANLLITRSGRAVLADFGLATAIDSKTIAMTHNSTTKTGGTVRWQAPELHNPQMQQHNNKATDIYAFGCVCYEVCRWNISVRLQYLTVLTDVFRRNTIL
jgi:serine/threonine protein kinase